MPAIGKPAPGGAPGGVSDSKHQKLICSRNSICAWCGTLFSKRRGEGFLFASAFSIREDYGTLLIGTLKQHLRIWLVIICRGLTSAGTMSGICRCDADRIRRYSLRCSRLKAPILKETALRPIKRPVQFSIREAILFCLRKSIQIERH